MASDEPVLGHRFVIGKQTLRDVPADPFAAFHRPPVVWPLPGLHPAVSNPQLEVLNCK